MSFLAPLFWYAGLAVAAGVVGLHFIVTRQPASSPLPTTRFVPEGTVRVTTVAAPEHLLLLLLRVLVVLLVAAAFARPVLVPRRRSVLHVVVADVSRAAGRIDEVRDSVRNVLRPGDALVVFDSAARVIRSHAADSAATLARTERGGRLSPALVVALRTASELRAAADSFELVIVSPLRSSESDGATRALRALWPGRARVVRTGASADTLAGLGTLAVRGAVDDAVAAGARAAELARGDSVVRVLRAGATAGDSAWAAGGRRTLVRWPAAGAPPGWLARPRVDTVAAVTSGDVALVAPLVRRWMPARAASADRVAARWVDGEPAATERVVGAGCIRDVAIELPARGDVTLRPAFGDLLRALGAPCARSVVGPPMTAEDVRALAGSGALAPAAAIAPADRLSTPLVAWLLGAALALALLELLVRRGAAARWTDAGTSVAEERVA